MSNVGHWLGNFLGLDGHISTISEGYAVFFSAIIVMVGWIVAQRNKSLNSRRENAKKYVITEDESIHKHVTKLSSYLKDKKPFPCYNPKPVDDEKEILLHVKALLTKMEVISTDINYGLVSENYVYSLQKSLIMNIFDQSKEYIANYRKIRKSNTIFENYETLYLRCKYGRKTILQVTVDFLFNRPVFFTSRLSFSIRYFISSLIKNTNRNHLLERNEIVSENIRLIDKCILICWIVIISIGLFFLLR